MPADINIQLDPEFGKGLLKLSKFFGDWETGLDDRLEKAFRVIVNRWHAECVKRVPVHDSTLKQRILTEVFKEAETWFGAVGTNLVYGKFLEFGTKYIAGGRVLALGDGTEITDEMAIKDWPAKSADSVGHMVTADGRLRNAEGKFTAKGGNSNEQMPWLRPAMNAIKPWALGVLAKAMLPPKL